MRQYSYTERRFPARARNKRVRENGVSITNGGGVSIAPGSGDASPGVTDHRQLSGIVSTVNDYSEFAADIHLAAVHADALKRLSAFEIIESDRLDTTESTDKNIYTALCTDLRIEESERKAEKKFLRKDIDDKAAGTITFEKDIILSGGESSLYSKAGADGFDHGNGFHVKADGTAWVRDLRVKNDSLFAGPLSSPKFVSGFPGGTGWMLAPYKRTNAAGVEETRYKLEIDDVDVRGSMRVHEMVVSQLLGENDNRIFAGMMEVDHYDPISGRIYLDTDGGKLYNPFRPGDCCVVRQFQGKPTMENGYDVTKSYEFTVKAVGVGGLSDGKDRLDWLTFDNLVGDTSMIARRDTVVRMDSVTDPTRKGIVKITTIDEFGAPYLDVAYGMKTDPENATKVRIGNLGGIVTPHFGRLEGYGAYLGNVFAYGKYVLSDTGEDVSTNFKILNGRLSSEMSSLRHELSEKDNYLTNSSFSEDTVGWETGNDVSLYTVSQRFIAVNDGLYSEQSSVAGVVEVYNRYALRIKDSAVTQRNAGLARRPEGQLDLPDGTKAWPTFHVSLMARVKDPGTLTVGFRGQNLYATAGMEASDSFIPVDIVGEWDGTGDFAIGFTGEIHIYNVALTDRPLDDFKVEMSTKITQTDREILLQADRIAKTEKGVETAQSGISVLADGIHAWSERITRNEEGIETISKAGFMTSADAAKMYAEKTDLAGDKIIGYINVQPDNIKISAKNIELDGKTIADIIEATDITTGRLTVTEGARIGPFVVSPAALVGMPDVHAMISMSHGKGAVMLGVGEAEVDVSCQDGSRGVKISAETGATGLLVEATGSGTGGVLVESSDSATGITIDSRGNDAVALLLAGGYIAGLKVQSRQVMLNTQVTSEDVFLSCAPVTDTVLYLPPSPQTGEVKLIRRNNGYRITVDGNGKLIRKGELSNRVEVGEGQGDMGLFLFDGLNWNYNVLFR